MSTAAQIATIHVLKKRVGLDDETYRAMLASMTGKRSSKDLTGNEAAQVIDKLKGSSGGGENFRARGAVADLDSAIGRKLRALWISGWNLGVVQDRHDKAMLAFLERQTGVSHVRFLQSHADSSKAIEGLKAWLAREADVRWPAEQDAVESRLAVIDAQVRRLHALGIVVTAQNLEAFKLTIAERVVGRLVSNIKTLSAPELTEVTRELGRLVRHAIDNERKRA